jgi:hypothetical protein
MQQFRLSERHSLIKDLCHESDGQTITLENEWFLNIRWQYADNFHNL